MTFSSAAPLGKDGSIEIYGREGALIMPQKPGNPNPPAHGKVLGGKVGDRELAELSIPERLELMDERNQQKIPPMRLLAREFVRGIETGTSPSPSFYDGYRVLEVLTGSLGALGMVSVGEAAPVEGQRDHASAQLVWRVDHHRRGRATDDSNAQSGTVRGHDQHRAYLGATGEAR